MLESNYKNYKINAVENSYIEAENIVKDNNQDINNSEKLKDISNNQETSILLFDDSGSVVIAYGASESEIKISDDETYQQIRDYAPRGKIFYMTFNNNIGPMPLHDNDLKVVITDNSKEFKKISLDNVIICAKFINYKGTSNYLLVVESRLSPVAPAVATLKTQLVYISIIVIVLAVLFAFIISWQISRPLKDMTLAANQLASGKRDIKFIGRGFKEIDELNNTLNYAVEELNKTDTLQKELLANISHDLKTPLTLIGGYAEMMKDLPEENTAQNLDLIVDEVNRLNNLVNDVLSLTRLQAGTETFNLSVYDITLSLNDLVKRQNLLWESRGFNIKFEYDKNVKIEADSHKIEQVFYNFISNAINYSGDKKEIIIKQEINGDMVKFSVIDFGCGIKEEDLKYIWNRYARVDKNHSRTVNGSGLGLSIVKEILEYHHFEYGVTSKVNEGSTFYFVAAIKE